MTRPASSMTSARVPPVPTSIPRKDITVAWLAGREQAPLQTDDNGTVYVNDGYTTMALRATSAGLTARA